MNFEDYLLAFEEPARPALRGSAARKGEPRSKEELWHEMVETFLLRDFEAPLNEVKIASDFTVEQLGYLRKLAEKDYATLIGAKKMFGNIGVPANVHARRAWLGFDATLGFDRDCSFEYQGKTYEGTLWRALYVAYWHEKKHKKVKAILAQIPQEVLLEFFLRWDELSGDEDDLFCEPVTEYGMALVPKYLKEPSPAVVAWAKARLPELLTEKGDRDPWIVLAVLAAELPKKSSFPEEWKPVFLRGRATIVGKTAARKVWNAAPVGWRREGLESHFGPLLSSEMPAPLELQHYGFMRDLPLELVKLTSEEQQIVYSAMLRAWELDSILFREEVASFARDIELPPPLDETSETERAFRTWHEEGALRAEDDEADHEVPFETLKLETIESFHESALAQLRGVAQKYFGREGSVEEYVRWGLEESLLWVWVKMTNRRGQRLVDAWIGFRAGEPEMGWVFLPEDPESIPGAIYSGRPDFSGGTPETDWLARVEFESRVPISLEEDIDALRAAAGIV